MLTSTNALVVIIATPIITTFCRKNNRCPKNSDWRKPDYFRIIRVSVCTGNHAALFCADGYFLQLAKCLTRWETSRI